VTKLALTVQPAGSDTPASKLLAQLHLRSATGDTHSQSVVLDIGRTTTLDVDPGDVPGHVFVQLRLPSGELLTDERVIEPGRDVEVTFGLGGSRPGWLGWHDLVARSPAPAAVPGEPTDGVAAAALVDRARLHRAGKPVLEIALDGPVTEGPARFTIHADPRAASLTIEGYDGDHAVVELVRGDGGRELVAAPLPWLGESSTPATIQLVLERSARETRASVIIQDPAFSSVLGYHASGDRASAHDFAPLIEARTRRAIVEDRHNPCAGVAGVLVLRRMAGATVPAAWLEQLAGAAAISDGAVLYATHLLGTRERRTDRARVRHFLLEAHRRGVPVFSACARLLCSGLRRLAAAGDPDDAELAAALAWSRALVDALRGETLFSWLAAEPAVLSALADGRVPAGGAT
jgi:hypothetical protein